MPRSVLALLWGPAALCAGGRRPAREIATREPAARSGRSRGPPWPCRHPPAPRPGPATHGRCSQALRSLRRPLRRRRCVAGVWLGASSRSPVRPRHPPAPRSGPATHWHRGQAPPPTGAAARPSCALWTLRRPPHQWCLVADVWLGASARCPARLRHGPRASQISRVKPVSPLLAQA